MHTHAIEGITLSSFRFQEQAHILSVFSKEHGRIKCVTKSTRKSQNRGLGPLLLVEMQVVISENELWKSRECHVATSFPLLRSSLDHLRYASQITDLLDKLLPLHHPVPHLYILYSQFLTNLANSKYPHVPACIFLEKFLVLEGMLEKESDIGAIDPEKVPLGYYQKLIHSIVR